MKNLAPYLEGTESINYLQAFLHLYSGNKVKIRKCFKLYILYLNLNLNFKLCFYLHPNH